AVGAAVVVAAVGIERIGVKRRVPSRDIVCKSGSRRACPVLLAGWMVVPFNAVTFSALSSSALSSSAVGIYLDDGFRTVDAGSMQSRLIRPLRPSSKRIVKR
ncbi:MAG: hypothetical protein MK108_15220, partial [Mariniblastus sp.]|nr:hypothetical protein [Mariniblastus sp.]